MPVSQHRHTGTHPTISLGGGDHLAPSKEYPAGARAHIPDAVEIACMSHS